MRVVALASIALLGASLAGCSMITVVPEGAVSAAQYLGDVFRDPRTQQEQTWDEIIGNTDVSRIGADRLNVEARGAALAGGGIVDLRLLVRAGSETLSQGYTHFAIVHVRDRNLPISGRLLGSPIYGSETVWIGSYENFVANRYERDYAAAPRAWIRPGMVAVVRMMNEDNRRSARAFNAREIYDSLVVDGGY